MLEAPFRVAGARLSVGFCSIAHGLTSLVVAWVVVSWYDRLVYDYDPSLKIGRKENGSCIIYATRVFDGFLYAKLRMRAAHSISRRQSNQLVLLCIVYIYIK